MLIAALAAVLAITPASPATKNAVSACGLTVVAPPRWKASVMSNQAGVCEIHLTPPYWLRLRSQSAQERDDMPAWAVRLKTQPGGIETVCAEYELCKEATVWNLRGEGDSIPVDEVTARGCRVFQGIRRQRVYGRTVDNGIGEFPTAVIIARKGVAIIEVDQDFEEVARGIEKPTPTFDAIVKSVACR